MRKILTIMFHSIGLNRHRWAYHHISSPIYSFENQIKTLRELGYTGLFFKDIAGCDSTGKYVSLTFDDGYLDNWVHVFPILEKYGMKATIFVSPEFVDTCDGVRPQQYTVLPEKEHVARGCCAGFLSWREMREMEKSGLVDIQSHTMSHTWHYAGPTIVDFWHPGSATESGGNPWMLWNAFPEVKPHYLTQAASFEQRIPYGTPVYEHGRALVTKRYFPNPEHASFFTDRVQKCGGAAFFQNADWRKQLRSLAAASSGSAPAGTYETPEQYYARSQKELTESKRLIEETLQKKVTCLCWPGGGVSEDVLRLAREAGYEHYTLPSAWQADRARGDYGDLIPRTGSGTVIRWGDKNIGIRTNAEFKWRIQAFNGSTLHKKLLRAGAVLRLFSYLLGFRPKDMLPDN